MIQQDVVFIDTSVFIAENYFSPGNRIYALGNLAKKGKIKLVMSEITKMEIRKHIKSTVRQAWKQFNKDCKILRNNSDIDYWRKSTSDKIETEKYLNLFDKFLSETFTKVLDYSYCSNSEKVFRDYFEQNKPFSEGKKKEEFPDAFVLTSLENYSVEINKRIIVLSNDGDMKDYRSQRLVYEEYGKYISAKIEEDVKLEATIKQIQNDKEVLEKEIDNAVNDYLDDFRLYLSNLNLTDVSSHSVNFVTVNLNVDNYEIVDVKDNYIEVEFQPEISFNIDVEYVNYDLAYYDREDEVWYGTEDEIYNIDSSATVRALFRYHFSQSQSSGYLVLADIDFTLLDSAIR